MVIKSKKNIKAHLHKYNEVKSRVTKKRKARFTGGTRTYTCDTTKLGSGGFGTVLGCKSNNSEELIAVKLAKNDKSVKELENENKIYNILGTKNDHIVKQIIDANIVFTVEPKPTQYLALEYCNGGDLSKFVKETEIYNITDILNQIFDGMCYLYDKHVLHLDLKPGNILVTTMDVGTHVFKIADFGLAKHISSGEENNNEDKTEATAIKVDLTTMKAGTPVYKPTFSNIDRSTYFRDLYAFYCIMYYLYYKVHYNIMPNKKKNYETNRITQQLNTNAALVNISTALIELQDNVLNKIAKDILETKAKGTVFTKRGHPTLNMSGFADLNVSGLSSNNDEPSFDIIKEDANFYNKYYRQITMLLSKPKENKVLPSLKKKEEEISLSGNTVLEGTKTAS